jgi:hypothetical protein
MPKRDAGEFGSLSVWSTRYHHVLTRKEFTFIVAQGILYDKQRGRDQPEKDETLKKEGCVGKQKGLLHILWEHE